MNGYKDLIVWQKAMDSVIHVYAVTSSFPKTEQYGLASQIQRAAVSIPSNIAEGYRRHGDKDKRHFYVIALGSTAEVETQLELARRLGYIKDESFANLIINELNEIAKILNKFIGLYPNSKK